MSDSVAQQLSRILGGSDGTFGYFRSGVDLAFVQQAIWLCGFIGLHCTAGYDHAQFSDFD